MAALSVDGTPMPALPNSADQINYDNTTSGLSATTVKSAVDELASEKQDKSDNSLQTTNKTIVGGINELRSGLIQYDFDTNAPLRKNLIATSVEEMKDRHTAGTWDGDKYTNRGITLEILLDNDGLITGYKCTGTATNSFQFHITIGNAIKLKTSCILNGCPSGGSDTNGYRLTAYYSDSKVIKDIGNGAVLTTGDIDIRITIDNGVALPEDGIIFTPMVRIPINDATYAPYIPSVEDRLEEVESGLTNVESAITPVMPSSNVTYIPFGNCVAITGSLNGNDDSSLPLGIPTNYYGVVMGRFTSTGKMSLYYVDSGYLRGWDGTTNRTFPSTDAITIHGILTFTQ